MKIVRTESRLIYTNDRETNSHVLYHFKGNNSDIMKKNRVYNTLNT